MNYNEELNRQVGEIGFARTDVYLLRIWQILLFFAGATSVGALLIVSVFVSPSVRAVLIICAAAAAITVVVYYAVLKFRSPMNYTDYYLLDGNERHVLRVFNRTAGGYYINGKGFTAGVGQPVRGADEGECYSVKSILSAEYTAKKESGIVTIYTGTADGKRIKAKLTDGVLSYCNVGGVRVRLFDLNDPSQAGEIPYAVAQECAQYRIRPATPFCAKHKK